MKFWFLMSKSKSMSTVKFVYSNQFSTLFSGSFESCTVPRFWFLSKTVNRTPTHTACTDAHSVSQHLLNRMITFHHANTRGSRLHICVSQNNCQPHVLSRSLPHLTLTTSTSSLSPVFPTIFSSHPQPFWRTINIYPAKFHSKVADQHKSHLSQVTSPT